MQKLSDGDRPAGSASALVAGGTALAGVAGAAMVVAGRGRGNAAAKLAGGALFGAASGAGAIQLTNSKPFQQMTDHKYLKYAVVPGAIWAGLGTAALLGGKSGMGRVHATAKALNADPRIGKPTKAAAALMMTPLHPIDWAAGAFLTGSMLRSGNRAALRDAWQAGRQITS